ncbi:MAG: LamG-like jellyroll fold domain-containing protein, partial [Candidatus Thermoplasmatota archaeon]
MNIRKIFVVFIIFLFIFSGITFLPDTSSEQWWNESWNYRIGINVNSGSISRDELYLAQKINFTTYFIGNFDENSIRVVESGIEVPSLFIKDRYYNTSKNALGTVLWLYPKTEKNFVRYFYVYFDIIENGLKAKKEYDETKDIFNAKISSGNFYGTNYEKIGNEINSTGMQYTNFGLEQTLAYFNITNEFYINNDVLANEGLLQLTLPKNAEKKVYYFEDGKWKAYNEFSLKDEEIKTKLNLSYNIGSCDGLDYGINGYGNWFDGIKIYNDFIKVYSTNKNLSIYDKDDKNLYTLNILDELKIDENGIGNIYSPTIYFFDWKENDWLIWQNVKKYFENFDDLNSSFWNGDLVITNIEKSNANITSGTKILYSNEKYTYATIEFRAKIGGDDNYPFFGLADAVPGNNYILFLWNKGLPGVISCKDGSSTFTSTPIINFKDWHIYKILWLQNSIEFYYDDNLVAVHYTNIPYLSLPIKFRTDLTFMLVDWVKINEDRGMPDWNDAGFKQEFKWRYGFKRINYPNINLTFLMTAHDPYIRVFSGSEHKPEITSDLVGFWKFDEGSGTIAKDSSYYSNNGNLNGFSDPPTDYSGWTSDCKLGSCLRFDGSNDYVNAGNLHFIGNQITVEAWAKAVVDGNIISKDSSGVGSSDRTFYLSIGPPGAGQVRWTLKTSAFAAVDTPAGKDYSDSQWHHFVGVYDGTNNILYIDGIECGRKIQSGNIADSNALVMIGATDYDGNLATLNEQLNGTIDNVRIYNRALTSDEIKQHYLEGVGHNLVVPVIPGMEVKRLGVKADYGNNKLRNWNQRYSKTDGNPWKPSSTWDFQGRIGAILINSGDTAYLHREGSYPSADTKWAGQISGFNWDLDRTNNKYSFEFYLDNDLQYTLDNTKTIPNGGSRPGNSTGATDGARAENTIDWSIGAGTGSVTTDSAIKVEGSASLSVSGTTDGSGWLLPVFNPTGTWDFSGREFLVISGKLDTYTNPNAFHPRIFDTSGNRREWYIENRNPNWNNGNWFRAVLPLNDYDSSTATPADLSVIDYLDVIFNDNPSTSVTYHIDDIYIDTGQWVKVESFVPDKLLASISGMKLNFWNTDTGSYATANTWDAEGLNGPSTAANQIHFLNGLDATEMYGDSGGGGNTLTVYKKASREQTLSALQGNAGSITYSSSYGVQKRIGFAIKMPPDDGQDSSTYGISQVKLKLEVYYDDEGKATYEFSNDNNQYYGLKNMLAPYVLLYNYQTNDAPLFLAFNRRDYSSSPLFVQADENEVITKTGFNINFNSTWGNNFMFTLGYLGGVDTATLISGDADVPDIFEGYKTWQFGNETFESIANSTLTYYDLRDDSLVGWWKFNEGWGNVAKDSSGFGNDGT